MEELFVEAKGLTFYEKSGVVERLKFFCDGGLDAESEYIISFMTLSTTGDKPRTVFVEGCDGIMNLVYRTEAERKAKSSSISQRTVERTVCSNDIVDVLKCMGYKQVGETETQKTTIFTFRRTIRVHMFPNKDDFQTWDVRISSVGLVSTLEKRAKELDQFVKEAAVPNLVRLDTLL
eukprot:m.53790 g.53790  ORF g.53790 m.53790 type:complete len:177 (+) comp11059_c1_seq4:72-602(+)